MDNMGSFESDDNPVAQRFADANDAGMNVFRFFGHGGDGGVPALESSPGPCTQPMHYDILAHTCSNLV